MINHMDNQQHEDNVSKLYNLAQLNGYKFKEENGQLIYGPPLDLLDKVPPKDSEVFIGRLPKDIDGCLIVNKFSQIGRIYTFRIMQNFSGLNRGFAFVAYETSEEADQAIRLFDKFEIRPGETIGVMRSRNNSRLFIGRLDNSLTKEQIFNFFNNLTPGIINLSLHNDLNTGHNYAFIEYQSHKDAAKSRRILKPIAGKVKIGNCHFTVDWASLIGSEQSETNDNANRRTTSLNFDSLRNLVEQIGKENSRFNNLSTPNQNFDNLNRTNSNNYQRRNDYVLVCTNVRKDANLNELSLVFSVNSKFHISKIKKQDNFILIHYSTVEFSSLMMKTFEDIQIDFSQYFSSIPNQLCQLIWPRSYTELNIILNNSADDWETAC